MTTIGDSDDLTFHCIGWLVWEKEEFCIDFDCDSFTNLILNRGDQYLSLGKISKIMNSDI